MIKVDKARREIVMKNGELFKNIITSYKENDFCDFIKNYILKPQRLECEHNCSQCQLIQAIWVNEEARNEAVDWTKIPVDTLVMIKVKKKSTLEYWEYAYFSKYNEVDGTVDVWSNGTTSLTGFECDTYNKDHVKLVCN